MKTRQSAAMAWKPPEFGPDGMTRWHWQCQHHEKLVLGEHVDIGAFCYLNAAEGITMEDNVQLGSHCAVYSRSTIDGKKGAVHFGRNARLGSHSTVLPGVTIGANAVIGAHSLVVDDIPENAVAYGVPCKVARFMDESLPVDEGRWK